MQVIICEHLWYKQSEQMLLRDITLSSAPGECLCLLGASGSGKTTLLRLLAGKVKPASGVVYPEGTLLADASLLRPRLTVADNIQRMLKTQGETPAQTEHLLMRLLALFDLENLHAVRSNRLSTTQRERLLLACCAARRPDTLLLDDVQDLSVLAPLREWMEEYGISLIYTLRSADAALRTADRIALLQDGRAVQCAAPDELLSRPATLYAAQYMSPCSVFSGLVTGVGKRGAKCRLDVDGIELEALCAVRPDAGDRMYLCIPCSCLHVNKSRPPVGQSVAGTVTEVRFSRREEYVTVQLPNGLPVTALRLTEKPRKWKAGDRVYVCWDMKNASLFPEIPQI